MEKQKPAREKTGKVTLDYSGHLPPFRRYDRYHISYVRNQHCPSYSNYLYSHLGRRLVYAITRYGLMALTPTTAADDILATMGDSLIMVDLNGKIIRLIKQLRTCWVIRQAKLVDKPFNSILVENTNDNDASWQEILEKGSISSRDAAYLARNGESIPVLVSASVVKDREGESVGGGSYCP